MESFENAANCIGPIAKDMSLFAITRGQFSMIDAIFHVLHEAGPAAISVWTWTIADYEVEAMAGLMARQEISAGRLVIDASADRRNSEIIEQRRHRFGEEAVRISTIHPRIQSRQRLGGPRWC